MPFTGSSAVRTKSLRELLRLEQILGTEIRPKDVDFIHDELPLDELTLLREFSEIDSSTLNLDGVARMQSRVAETLEEIGFKINILKGEPRFGELILAERPGSSAKFISIVTHCDTVLTNYRPFAVSLPEERAFGSGVIDNKGGLVVGLGALKRFLKAFPSHRYGLRFICSPNEEMGSIGFTETFRQLGKDTAVGFGLEPALDNGSIIHQRRGNRWYDVEIIGREAHAGRSYGEHANAAHDAAQKIVRLARLTQYKRDISVNVGHIEGGKDRHNIICGKVKIKLDVRFPSVKSREILHQKIGKILKKSFDVSVSGKFKTHTTYQVVDDCPPFSLNRRSKHMAHQYASLVSRLESRPVKSESAGGAGDVNYLSTGDNFILDGLGPVGGEMHTQMEFVHIPSLKTRSQALAGYLRHLQTTSL